MNFTSANPNRKLEIRKIKTHFNTNVAASENRFPSKYKKATPKITYKLQREGILYTFSTYTIKIVRQQEIS